MKTVCLTLTAAVSVQASDFQLFNLRNAEVLGKAQELNQFETVAHLETFDHIPVFGGHELRQKMLKESSKLKEKSDDIFKNIASDPMGLVKDISRGFSTVTMTVGCHISSLSASGLASAISGNAPENNCGRAVLESVDSKNGALQATGTTDEFAHNGASSVNAGFTVAAVASALYLQ
jgi:hypothetical protein